MIIFSGCQNRYWYRPLYANSVIFRFSDIVLQNIQYEIYGGYTPGGDDEQLSTAEMSRAGKITEKLFEMMADAVPAQTGLVTFSCETDQPALTELWASLARKAGFTPLPDVSLAVEKSESEGVPVRAADGVHWGPKGHHIAGQVLSRAISRLWQAAPRSARDRGAAGEGIGD
jgi:hypothetical protein